MKTINDIGYSHILLFRITNWCKECTDDGELIMLSHRFWTRRV